MQGSDIAASRGLLLLDRVRLYTWLPQKCRLQLPERDGVYVLLIPDWGLHPVVVSNNGSNPAVWVAEIT